MLHACAVLLALWAASFDFLLFSLVRVFNSVGKFGSLVVLTYWLCVACCLCCVCLLFRLLLCDWFVAFMLLLM